MSHVMMQAVELDGEWAGHSRVIVIEVVADMGIGVLGRVLQEGIMKNEDVPKFRADLSVILGVEARAVEMTVATPVQMPNIPVNETDKRLN
jgi:hypothetical protein